MKTYPSIPRNLSTFRAHTFDKIDGSNLRFEWTKKHGWVKFGTRRTLFDETHDVFGGAIELFHQTMASKLHDIACTENWELATFFAEFGGRHSFAGSHIKDEPKLLTLIDVAIYKQGLISPVDFRKKFEGQVLTPRYLGNVNWTKGFRDRVFNEQVDGISFEGAVGKLHDGKKVRMTKAKTCSWIDAVKLKFAPKEANKIINS